MSGRVCTRVCDCALCVLIVLPALSPKLSREGDLEEVTSSSSTMASAASVTSLADEVNCPVWQGTLREPVTIDCGHNFCRVCLTRYLEITSPDPEEPPTCPLCKEPFRPGNFRPNWQLANVVENIERLKLVSQMDSDEDDVCPEHGEKVYFFCEDDEMQLCVVCREAWEHRAHTVRFLEDAAGPYRVRRGN